MARTTTAREPTDGEQARKHQRLCTWLGNDGNDRDADIDRDGQHIEVRIRAAACLDAHRIKHGVLRDAEV